MSVNELLTSWETINTALGLSGPVRDDAHYAELLAFVDEVFEKFGHDDQHPIFTLVNLVAERIREYEDRQHPWPDSATPAGCLALLMESHGLNQKDLPAPGRRAGAAFRCADGGFCGLKIPAVMPECRRLPEKPSRECEQAQDEAGHEQQLEQSAGPGCAGKEQHGGEQPA